MTDGDKKAGNGAKYNGLERWRGEMTAIIKELNTKMTLVVSSVDAMRRECNKRHVCLEHRLTSLEQYDKSITHRMAGLTKILIGSVVIIVGTAAAVALFVK